MAYYDDLDEEQQDGSGQPVQQGPSGSGVITGAGGAPSANQGAAANTPDRGANFVGIKDYLDANKNQSGKLGDQTSGVIQNSADTARGSINNLNSSFNQKAGTAVSNDASARDYLNYQGADKLDDQQKQLLKQQYNAQYAGPSDLMDETLAEQYSTANKNLGKAKTNVESSGTEEGRKNLITQVNEKPRTAGITNFDSLLLQAGGGREKLANASAANQDVTGDLLGSANLAAQQKASDIKSQNDSVRTATQGAVGTHITANQNRVNDLIQKALKNATANSSAMAQDVTDLDLDYDTAEAYGLNTGDTTYGLDLGSYLKDADLSKINKDTAATDFDYARYLALAEIAGIKPEEQFLSADKRSLAGTAPKGPTVDAAKFNTDRAGKQQAYDNFYNTQAGGIVSSPTANSITRELGNPATGAMYQGLEGLANATPKQLETQYLPLLTQMARNTQLLPEVNTNANNWLKDIKGQLDAIKKNQYGMANTVTKKDRPAPTVG